MGTPPEQAGGRYERLARRLYPVQAKRTSHEAENILSAQVIAGVVALLAIVVSYWWVGRQAGAHSQAVRSVRSDLGDFAAMVESGGKASDTYITQVARNVVRTVHKGDTESAESVAFRGEVLQQLDEVKLDGKEVRTVVGSLTTTCETMLARSYPCSQHTRRVRAWMVVGVLYCAMTVVLYRRGLSREDGEAMFNVVDVGFYSALAALTGGVHSWLTFFLAPSVLLAAMEHFRLAEQARELRRKAKELEEGAAKLEGEEAGKLEEGPRDGVAAAQNIVIWPRTLAYAWALCIAYFLNVQTGEGYASLLGWFLVYAALAAFIGIVTYHMLLLRIRV